MRSLAVLSLHTSPLVQPGSGDSGGMNVYVRELVSSLAQRGVDSTVYVRRWRDDLDDEVLVEPGFRVVHIPAGPTDLVKEQLPAVVGEFRDRVGSELRGRGDADAILANYWLSGVAGHQLKHELDLPLITVFHTLARVKAETGDPEPQRRIEAEAEVIACSDAILANSIDEQRQLERLYDARPERIQIVPPGVDHAFFSPGFQGGARAAIGLDDAPVLLFVGRIQPLKGVDVAVRALAELEHERARLLIVGGASGLDGSAEERRVRSLVAQLGLEDRVEFHEPQPHHRLSTFYRAADAVVMPSRSESFGLVALEAAACGVPVVAAAVGGLRTLVRHGETGFLVEGRDPGIYAAYLDELLANPGLATKMAADAVDRSWSYRWADTAEGVAEVYDQLTRRALVDCT